MCHAGFCGRVVNGRVFPKNSKVFTMQFASPPEDCLQPAIPIVFSIEVIDSPGLNPDFLSFQVNDYDIEYYLFVLAE